MAITYDDFLKTVEADNLAFVNEVHKLFMDNGWIYDSRVIVLEQKGVKIATFNLNYVLLSDLKRSI